MPLVRVRTIYERARRSGYAVGGFDAEHMDMVKAIIEAAEEVRSPVIVMLWEADIETAGQGYLEAIVKEAAMEASVPVGIQLDHGTSLKSCLQCILNGHTGVMVDYSHLDFETNIALTKQVVDVCHLIDVWVEAEVGTVPRTFESEGAYAEEKQLTNPDQAAEFIMRTGVDALTVSIGEESGVYKTEPHLDTNLLREIAKKTDTYLIMHGGSGTPPDQLHQIVAEGITGIRFATELRIAFFDTMEQMRTHLGHDFPDSRKMLKPAREAVKKVVKERMWQMGSYGQACTDGLCPPIFHPEVQVQEQPSSSVDVNQLVELIKQELSKRG
jgi:ketose-bisphosphate aldolase